MPPARRARRALGPLRTSRATVTLGQLAAPEVDGAQRAVLDLLGAHGAFLDVLWADTVPGEPDGGHRGAAESDEEGQKANVVPTEILRDYVHS